jgi:copper chaperone
MTRVYSVPGISCGNCRDAIEGAVAQVQGVSEVVVDISEKTVRVEGAAEDEAIRSAIDAAGYDVEEMRTT